ncbi:hypothetical protein SADUNF_Sadunf10G0146700 [Salix dunnii]|uniref:Tetratricopeptide repeat-like superfamily protein n=1 Tax=Salix dunnii TaxID=1413687 RepID=A0A835JU84_9ROSI|nr:hypothetical protein SADUNF_Sadunf10G0146700 [Salix dunnii]
MGMESLQSWHLIVLPLSSTCRRPVFARSYFGGGSHPSIFFGSSRNLKSPGLERSCSDSLDEFYNEEIEYLARNFDALDDDENDYNDTAYAVSDSSDISKSNDGESSKYTDNSESFLPSKIEFLEPNFLGIQPEPPDWPERNEIARMNIELRAKSVDIPLSLRMIKRKLKWQKGFAVVRNSAYCSVNRAFASMVLIIQELQSHALYIRESRHGEDLERILEKVHSELNASFVWLFQQVFSRTPTLMVYVMLLLANFTVHSMVGNIGVAATTSTRIFQETITTRDESDQKQSNANHVVGNNNGGAGKVDRSIGGSDGGIWRFGRISPFIRYPNLVPEETGEGSLPGNQETVSVEETVLWNAMVEEASRMQVESGYEVLDRETMKHFVSRVTVDLEPSDYVEYYRTDLLYQMAIAEDPKNPLLLSNYAQFLYTVRHDYDRAEKCFKRATMVGPPDAEAFSLYADFLWRVRKDLWSAEERYLQALSIEPNNTEHASKYASFLWSTGGEETCFPPNAPQ